MKTELEPETCHVVWLSLLLEDFYLFKMLLKFSNLLMSSKLVKQLDHLLELTSFNSLELLIYSIISLNSHFHSTKEPL